ncbi:MAG: phospholipase [Planctomycetaceae bacterium]|nr:phospholipase [Planctomycetaceae bacterium]
MMHALPGGLASFVSCCLLLTLLAFAGQSATAQDGPQLEHEPLFEAHTFSGEAGETLPYRLMKPLAEGDDADQKYPLLVFLHGFGERGDDNLRQLYYLEPLGKEELRKRHPAFVLAPQCPAENDDAGRPITWTARLNPGETPAADAKPTAPMGQVIALLDKLCEELPIDRTRIYVSGLSMGGYGTWDLAARLREQVAAVAPICGGGDPGTAEKLAGLPIWAFHGGADGVVPPERSREMVAAVRAAGGTAMLTEYPGVGHDSWKPALRERLLWDWMFAQRRQP